MKKAIIQQLRITYPWKLKFFFSMTESEPPVKKTKTDNSSFVLATIASYVKKLNETKSLQVVLSDDIEKPLPQIKVYVGHIKDPKTLQKINSILNEKVPLTNLQHLKRIWKREVLLCPTNFFDSVQSIQDFLMANVPELTHAFDYFKEIEVPMKPPKLKRHYNNQVWSCFFHPNKYLESLVSDNFFSPIEMQSHVTYMQIAFEAAGWHLERDGYTDVSKEFLWKINATVVVDPIIKSVVAVSYYGNNHPIQHSVMLAIDNVAKTQNGGAWGVTNDNSDIDSDSVEFSGIDKELLKFLQKKFRTQNFGARPCMKRDIEEKNQTQTNEKAATSSNSQSSALDKPYLCTGYYIYTIREPCLMCAMALVHARAKRVFFCLDNLESGALKSKTRLHTVPSLNHHYEVFTGFL